MDHFVAQRQRLRSLFGVFFAPEVTGALLPLARPALRLGVGGDATVHLGGDPLLPPGEPWPTWQDRPLDFLASFDFGELAEVLAVPGLPQEGRAAFYYAASAPRPWGDDAAQRDGWRLFTGDLVATEAQGQTFPQLSLGVAPFLSLPAPQEPAVHQLDERYSGVRQVYEQLHAAWLQHVWPDDAPVHQLGGWPALVQTPLDQGDLSSMIPKQAAADQERSLLLQLDSDPRLGWDWGAPGRIYFSACTNEPLENAWLTLQA
ncbi:DUF1963 domain-containing protein [Actinomadura barringtoniae]|uniref:DUF1963 domain-containing protein n=1 Tax=Actinomadura barringtoniae TaxID=1427535 RepID=A0A939TGQ5_9ACTN|nr:YwqG family protein [Actinomadura barringtoniae]MBO2455650.1 DUF1963 domain-containing protein [Actinomadura barringtoniae]